MKKIMKHKFKVYWLQFVLAAIWSGILEIFLNRYILHYELRAFLMNVAVVLTGILAFQPFSRKIFKYLALSIGASALISILRNVGHWYLQNNVSMGRVVGPVGTLFIISVVLILIFKALHKDSINI